MAVEQITVGFDLSRLHPAQQRIFNSPARFRVAACGRRFGKTELAAIECMIVAAHGGRAWFVSPVYSQAKTAWRSFEKMARQIPGSEIRRSDLTVNLPSGGEVVVRSVGDSPALLRGDGLDHVVLEEASFMKAEVWTDAIRPALSDKQGRALFISTPAGKNHFHELWTLGITGEPDWASFQFPTSANPHILAEEIEAARRNLPAHIFEREYEASFEDASGAVFRGVRDCLYSGDETYLEGRRYMAGVDLAQRVDYTAVVVLDTLTGRVVDMDRYNGLSWALQRGRIKALSDNWHCTRLIVEENSVGSVVIEDMHADRLPIKPFLTTNQSKQEVVENLSVAFERGEISLPSDHKWSGALLAELDAFQGMQLESGRWKYAAGGSAHDDLVIALALVWHEHMDSQRNIIEIGYQPPELANYRG